MTKCQKNYETEDVEFEKNMPFLLKQEKDLGGLFWMSGIAEARMN